MTQASPQITRRNLLAKKLLESLPKPLIFQESCLKKVTDLTMIYFILPKQPTNLQASFRIVQLVKRQALDREVVGSIPAQTTGFFGFLFLFPKKKYVRAFSQPESTNQPVTIFSTGRSEKRKKKKSALVFSQMIFSHQVNL